MNRASSRPAPFHRPRGARLSAALVVVGLALTACGKIPVTIPTLRLTAADQAVCQRVVNALPDKLGGQSRRKTQPAEALAGAWGDPALVVQCGVGEPAGLTRTSRCIVADGVGWFVPPDEASDNGSEAVLTAIGYRPYLQLTAPSKYRGAALAAAEVQLAPIVKKYLKPVHPCL